MKPFNLINALLITLIAPLSVFAQDQLQPCGTFTRSATLTSDCLAPLIVGANNIKINLNGFAVKSGLTIDSEGNISIKNKRGVTVTNGIVEGACGSCVLIESGHSNKLSNLTFLAEEFLFIGVLLRNTDKNQLEDITIHGRGGIGMFVVGSNKNKISRLTALRTNTGVDFYASDRNRLTQSHIQLATGGYGVEVLPTVTAGAGNVISENEIVGDASRGIGIRLYNTSATVLARNTVIKSNTITNVSWGIHAGDGTSVPTRNLIAGNTISDSDGYGIYVGSIGNTIRSNVVRNSGELDMVDTSPQCAANKWSHNIFSTDSEGDGPSAGCIQ